ncbi:MAG: VCBS repeat-containing protein [Sedimentisphaerales bacterium]|nr:VCBS repeat-containing protein [Sedimentisphaerales bacterium]
MQPSQKNRFEVCLVSILFLAFSGVATAGALHLGPEQLVCAGQPPVEINTRDYSVPSFTDINNDGLPDLIVSDERDLYRKGRVRIYPNQGSIRRPRFESFFFAQSQIGNITQDIMVDTGGCMVCFPRAVDWDRDGRMDLLLGLYNGQIELYMNIGTPTQPVFDEGVVLNLEQQQTVDLSRATPIWVDWNHDGRSDLITGTNGGLILVYLNQSDTNEPSFGAGQIVQTTTGDLFVPSRKSSPEFLDLDGDGKKDLLTGNTDGQILFYRNIGTRETPMFDNCEMVESAGIPIDLEGIPRSRPSVCDWTGDGRMDLLVGAGDGKVRLYEGQTVGVDGLTATITKAGRRLASLQNDDGGWDDPLTDGDPASGTILTQLGTMGLGLAVAYQESQDPNLLDELELTGQLLLTRTDDFLASEGAPAVLLDTIFGTTLYSNHVRTAFYDRLADGTYYDALTDTPDMDTAGYIQSILDFYGEDLVNTAAWDLGFSLYDAHVLGADTTEWITAVKEQIDRLDSVKPDDVIGLAGAIFGLASVGQDYNPQSGAHADANSLSDLTEILTGYQLASGGFTYSSQFMTVGEDETVTVTAAGILALEAVDRHRYWSQIAAARSFLQADQLLSSGWEDYIGAGENNLVTAETIRGLAASRPAPGDIQDDGRVDMQDLAALSRFWRRTDCGACSGADLNRDGQVNLFDLMILAEHWTDGKDIP